MTLFNTLPLSVQNNIKDALSVYDEVTLYKKENGSFYTSTVTVLHTSNYDEKICVLTKDEVFTEEEIIINYVESFKDFPINYTGTKDWKSLYTNWEKVIMVEGNLVFK